MESIDRAVSSNTPTDIHKYWWGFTGSNLSSCIVVLNLCRLFIYLFTLFFIDVKQNSSVTKSSFKHCLFLYELVSAPLVGRDRCGEPHHWRPLPPQVRPLQLLLQRCSPEGENILSLVHKLSLCFHRSRLYSMSSFLIFGVQKCKSLRALALLSCDIGNVVLCSFEPLGLCVQSDVGTFANALESRLFPVWQLHCGLQRSHSWASSRSEIKVVSSFFILLIVTQECVVSSLCYINQKKSV